MAGGIDTTRLRVFREVLRQGSFTGAATALQITQPAVSQHIARLEQEFGCVLLERAPSRQVRPTPAGEVFLRYVETLLTGLAETRRELAALARSDSGPLRVAVFPSAVASFVPSAVGALREQFPKVSILMSEADPPQALARLLAGDVDLAVCYDYPSVAAPRDARLRITSLALDRMAVAVPDSGATRRGAVPLAELAAEQWIVPGPSLCRTALEEACRRSGFSPRVAAETNDYQAMVGLVGAGVGIAVVPRLAAGFAQGRPVRLLPLSGTRLARRVDVVDRLGGARTPAMECLHAILADELAQVLAAAFPAAEAPALPVGASAATAATAAVGLAA